MEKTEDRAKLDRLPKWAREEILKLRRSVLRLEGKLAAGPEESDAFLDPYSEAPRPLGRKPVIRFGKNGEGFDTLGEFDVRFADGELVVNGMSPSFDTYLAVLPQSGNQVMIKHVKKDQA